MHLYIPFASVHLIDASITHHDYMLGIRANYHYGRRIKLRNASPGNSGIPHWDVSLRLFPKDDVRRKFSRPRIADQKPRRINGVCWHGHAQFMARMFDDFPYMTLRSSSRMGDIEYAGVDDFLKKYMATREAGTRDNLCQCAYRFSNLHVVSYQDASLTA